MRFELNFGNQQHVAHPINEAIAATANHCQPKKFTHSEWLITIPITNGITTNTVG
jgi:uncharacterized protein YecA (UPF0149 family)